MFSPFPEPQTPPFEDGCSQEQLHPEDALKRQFKGLVFFLNVALVEVPAIVNQFQFLG